MLKHINSPLNGGCLAFDFGKVRIGVAQGECGLGIATPLTILTGKSNQEKFQKIEQLIQQWQPKWLVVGLPVYLDGTEHELTRLSRQFGRRLNGRFKLPVFYVDERLSSIYAEALLKEAGVTGQKQKKFLDQVAAQALLQSFFDEGAISCFAR